MELSKGDTQAAKGLAVIGMVMLHLFCRLGDLPYEPFIWIGDTPLMACWVICVCPYSASAADMRIICSLTVRVRRIEAGFLERSCGF